MAGVDVGGLIGRLRGKKPAGPPKPQSLRLTFAYDEEGVRLVRSAERPKPAPPGADLARERPPGRIAVELRRSNGKVLYRAALGETISPTASSGTFSAVVPIESNGDHVALVAGERVALVQPALAAALERSGAKRELGRFPLASA
ncbi:MAG: hypothetical protein R3C15_14870 [Thermoleophilia bacterium]